MQVSLTGLLHHAADALGPPEGDRLRALEERLRVLYREKAQGAAAIDRLIRWCLAEAPLVRACAALPLRPTRRIAQPGFMRFSLEELAKHLGELHDRREEGERVLDEFFATYVFEPAEVAHAG